MAKILTAAKRGPYVLLHKESGLKIGIPGSYGFHLIEGTEELPVGTNLAVTTQAHVQCWYHGGDVEFYVEDVKHVHKVLELLKENEGSDPVIAIDPDYFKSLLASAHQAYLDGWARSPGQGCY